MASEEAVTHWQLLRGRHTKSGPRCRWCRDVWPCDATKLLDDIDALQAAGFHLHRGVCMVRASDDSSGVSALRCLAFSNAEARGIIDALRACGWHPPGECVPREQLRQVGWGHEGVLGPVFVVHREGDRCSTGRADVPVYVIDQDTGEAGG